MRSLTRKHLFDQAKILGIVATDYNPTSEVTISSEVHEEHSTRGKFLNALVDLDLFGLLLFASGWSLMLIPLTLVNNATNTWNSPKIIAMITIGCALLVAFVWYEAKVARLPIIPFRFFKNRTVVCACVIGFFDFVSFYLQVSPTICQIKLVWADSDINRSTRTSTPSFI